jgi:hypothetical protein
MKTEADALTALHDAEAALNVERSDGSAKFH